MVQTQQDWNPANSGGLSQFLAKQTMRLKPSGRTQINIETRWQKLRSASTNNPKTHIEETKPDRRWDWWTRSTLQTEKSKLRTGYDDDGGAGDELRQRNMEGERRTKRWKVMNPRVSNWLGCKMFFFFFFFFKFLGLCSCCPYPCSRHSWISIHMIFSF